MKSRGVVGKRIVKIEQQYLGSRLVGDFKGQSVTALILEDGTTLELRAQETEEDEPYVQVFVLKPNKKQ